MLILHTPIINKVNILFPIPLNMCLHDTPTVLVQVIWKSELSGKFFCLVALLIAYGSKTVNYESLTLLSSSLSNWMAPMSHIPSLACNPADENLLLLTPYIQQSILIYAPEMCIL